MTSSSNKKYTLFSSAQGGVRPCAFFASKAGCRNGANCQFSHETSSTTEQASPDVGSVVSSEESDHDSGDEDKSVPEQNQQQAMKASSESAGKKNKKKKNRRGKVEKDPFVPPKKKVKTSPEAQLQEKKEPAEKKEPIVKQSSNKKKDQLKATATSSSNSSKSKKKSFLKMDLPIAPFTCVPEAETASNKDGTKDTTADNAEAQSSTPAKGDSQPNSAPKAPELPLPKSHPEGRKWLQAVKATRQHESFSQQYDIDKMQQLDAEIGLGAASWIETQPYSEQEHAEHPQVIAVDCEMCETQDPVSGQKDPHALCRVSIVDAVSGDTLLDSLVQPPWPVVDHRTWVNGIGPEHLATVQFTLRHAQAFLSQLCSQETVILGHAVHNDLAALRLKHYCVVDSAMLFQVKDAPSSTIGLRDLVKSILKEDMPKRHDSVNDAKSAMRCLQHWMEQDGKVEPVARASKPGSVYAKQLFVHRIPKRLTSEHLANMFLQHTAVQPLEIETLEFSGAHGKTHVNFRSAKHANLAFETLEGPAEAEASGRLQKKVHLKNGGYVRVRKMTFEKRRDSTTGASEVATPKTVSNLSDSNN